MLNPYVLFPNFLTNRLRDTGYHSQAWFLIFNLVFPGLTLLSTRSALQDKMAENEPSNFPDREKVNQ